MVMEAQELVMGSKEIMKGKRTKRQRPMSPLRLAVTSSSSSGGGGGGGSEQQQERIDNSSIEFAESTIGGGRGEEEDMANCLILLAQGSTRKILPKSSSPSKASPELYIYQCKTCNKCFSSFQALGGHRASHKKPNNNNKISNYEEMKKVIIEDQEQDHVINNNMNTTLSLQIPNSNHVKSNNKVHECSVCGAEFSSGQALGGHMRRHRAAFASTNATTSSSSPPEFQEKKKPRNSLQLDLNLPAPEDDLRDSQFHFGSKEQVLVFSASSLVDCHY